MGIRIALSFLIVTTFFCGGVARAKNATAQEGFYMMIFGYQDAEDDPKSTHTFASFMRDADLVNANNPNFQIPTISWLPNNDVIRPFQFQIGRNYTLRETVITAVNDQSNIRYWGALQITPSLYTRAMQRIQFLQSGQVWYKAIGDAAGPDPDDLPGYALNCIHAVSDIGGPLQLGWDFGWDASSAVVSFLSPYVYNYPAYRTDIVQAFHIPEILAGKF
jgi:hypothetical protein